MQDAATTPEEPSEQTAARAPESFPPSIDLIVSNATNEIVAYGSFPSGTDDPDYRIETVDPSKGDIFAQPGKKTWTEGGGVSVEPPPPEPEPEPTKNDILLMLLDGVDPSDPDVEIMWLVLQESLRS